MLEAALKMVLAGNDLTAESMQAVIEQILAGQEPAETIGQLLLALRAKGEVVSELVGAALAMRAAMTPIRSQRQGLLDTCGTGGDGTKTFNISTAAAVVAAASGVPVAKHGNRKITSATGSADVLSQLGIRVDAQRETVERCLDELGIGFCFAPQLHPAMRHVAEIRRKLGVPTLFNYLGPLCNPAGAEFQLLGVGKQDLQEKIAATLAQLPIHRAIVVRGLDGMDEVSLSADTDVIEVHRGECNRQRWSPSTFGLKEIDVNDLKVEGPAESATMIRSLLSGSRGAPRDIVLANAAAGVWLAGHATTLKEAVAKCALAIDNGSASSLLQQLAVLSNAPL